MDRPAINNEAEIQVIILIRMVSKFMEKVIVSKIEKEFEAMIMLPMVRIRPIREAIMPTITVAKYLPVINSLALIGKVRSVSRVPFSFSTAVAEVAILVPARTIDIII